MAERPSRPALRIALSIEHPGWLRRVPDARVRCRKLIRAALAAGRFASRDFASQGRGATAELSIVLGDDAFLRRLNREFRGQDKPTNVLSFVGTEAEHLPESPVFSLGDIAIAYETSASEAREQGKTLAAHLSHLVVHGVLHLLGYDHVTKAQANDMETLETAVLARFGLTDPYRARAPRQKRRATRDGNASRRQPRAARPTS